MAALYSILICSPFIEHVLSARHCLIYITWLTPKKPEAERSPEVVICTWNCLPPSPRLFYLRGSPSGCTSETPGEHLHYKVPGPRTTWKKSESLRWGLGICLSPFPMILVPREGLKTLCHSLLLLHWIVGRRGSDFFFPLSAAADSLTSPSFCHFTKVTKKSGKVQSVFS